jgi:glycosyltransferase involved in cell wall biosynthesis/peptidoglycan/xylan/chitin deacetylase (PgdA/CDA1 family)
MFLGQYFSFLKPFIPRPLQIFIRRKLVNWKLQSCGDRWPIDKTAAKPPENWQGWPEGKKFALVLTHDVEAEKGVQKCQELMAIDEQMGFKSAFNFVATDYNVPAGLLNKIKDRGFEVGVHGIKHKSNIYRSKKIFSEQAEQINQYMKQWEAVGFRSPSMFHNLDYNHALNIEYDASTFDTDPFEPQSDGAGTIFPFWVSGNSSQKGYVELPYTLPQDFLLFILMQEKGIDLWKTKLDWIAKHGGMALFITHPDYMNFDGKKLGNEEYSSQYYQMFLEYINTKYKGQFWNALPRDMARFWAKKYGISTTVPVTSHPSPVTTSAPIHVCMLAYSFYESDGRIRRYAETLAKRGDRVDAIALRKEGQPSYEIIEGVHVYRIQKRMIDEKGKISYLLKLATFLINSLTFLTKRHLKDPYDLIHVHSVPDFEVFATIFPKLQGTKIILDIHDIVPEFYASKFHETEKSMLFKALVMLERISIKYSDQVIISNHLWEKTILSRSVERNKCTVIMNYPDESIFYKRPRLRNDDKFIMIYPGTLGWHQGLDIAIKAFALIKDQVPGAEFHIYGRGPEKSNIEGLINQLGLEKIAFIKETLPIEQIADVMANADLGIIPKRNDPFGGEAFSTKILEFMSLGVPVIVSETKIDRFYFNDSVVKFFQPEDANDLAQSMISMIKGKEIRERFASTALNFVQEFSWERRKQEYFDLVDTLIKK